MPRIRGSSIFFICLVHCMLPNASADTFFIETRGEAHFGGSLNLGELVGAAHDSASDLTPVRVGFVGGLGYQNGRIGFGVDVGVGAGGLELDRLENIYFGSPKLPEGDTAYLSSGASAQYVVYQHGKWSVPAAIRLGWARLTAASPAGAADVDFLYGELGVGLSYQFTEAHNLSLGALAQTSRVVFVHMGEQDKQRPVDSPWFLQPGFGLFYRFTLGV